MLLAKTVYRNQRVRDSRPNGNALREIDDDFPKVNHRILTIIRIRGGECRQGVNVGEVRDLIFMREEGDIFLAVWPGRWKSDAFGPVSAEVLALWDEQLS